MVNRERTLVWTSIREVDFDNSTLERVLSTIQTVISQHGDQCKIEYYTEYYGGNEGSFAIRIMKYLPESDIAYAKRVKYEEECHARTAKTDLETYERVKSQLGLS